MIYAYIRVSTAEQSGSSQEFEIKNWAHKQGEEISQWVSESVSGTIDPKKRKLGKLLRKMKPNDLLVCTEISRLGRSMLMIMAILDQCATRELRIHTIKDNFDLNNNINSKIIAFAFALAAEIERQIGPKPFENPEYGRMVNEKHFRRVLGLIDPAKTVYGGQSSPETLQIAPTLLAGVSFDDAVMGQEIFGPVLPVLDIEQAGDAIAIVNRGQKPLALYVFTSDRATAKRITTECAFGGGCINDTIIHLATSAMGFGGVGESGMGAYHGKTGFDAFSHRKSIVDKKTWIDLNMRYRPYSRLGEAMIRRFLK